ncbi:DinB family protein [Sanguibacter sp. 25GB23B1]|uniref:DinB family protein n=1 Tax=unclassified Sanguibacter TaxID=2645534 RepID=UPI0032B012FA
MAGNRIPPDTKDWTWVLGTPCPECGFVAADVTIGQIGPAVRAGIPQWTVALMSPGARVRPDATTWSTLEYAAHVRDVFRLFAERLALMLREDHPTFDDWDQDAAAEAADYPSLDPMTVAVELEESGRAVAGLFDAVQPSQVSRTGLRSNGSEFTVLTFGQYFLHDVVHHVHDVVEGVRDVHDLDGADA